MLRALRDSTQTLAQKARRNGGGGGGDARPAVRLPPRLGGDVARRARTADHRCKGGCGGGQGAHAVAPSRSTEHLGRSYRQRHGGRTGPRRHTAHVQILRGRGHLPRYCAVHSERKRAKLLVDCLAKSVPALQEISPQGGPPPPPVPAASAAMQRRTGSALPI